MNDLEQQIIDRISAIDNHDTILVNIDIFPDLGTLTDIEYNEYRIIVHSAQLTNEIIDEVIVRFSVSANHYTTEMIDSLSEQARHELNGYDFRRVCIIEDTEEDNDDEMTLDDMRTICYVYEVKTIL